MPEPDFERIAERIALLTGAFQAPLPRIMADLAEQLRQVWNARGAADIEKLEAELSSLMGETAYAVSTYGTSLDHALRSLDR